MKITVTSEPWILGALAVGALLLAGCSDPEQPNQPNVMPTNGGPQPGVGPGPNPTLPPGQPGPEGTLPAQPSGPNPTPDPTPPGDPSSPGSGQPAPSPVLVDPGGYITSGAWKGFAWSAPGGDATITPTSFETSKAFPLCVQGTVQPGYDNLAMLGWNINQAAEENAPLLTVSPAAEGVTIAISNPGGTELRLQIQGPNGETDPNDRWCAVIPGSGGFIPYDGFNTECWVGGEGMAYAGQPLSAVLVMVPGPAPTGTAAAYDFCVNELYESDAGGGAPVSQGCSLSGSVGEGGGSITGDQTRTVTKDGRQYIVQNNVWSGNAASQTINANGVSFEVTAQSNNNPTDGAPASFPSSFIGSNFGRTTSGSNLPRQVSALTSVQTGWRWSGGSGSFNAAYDVWFSTGAGGDPQNPSGAYLMVWFAAEGGPVPLGTIRGTVSIGGRSWQVWHCGEGCQNGVNVISYIPTSGSISEWSFDLLDFIANARDQFSVIQNSWYLTNVFAGFEIWSGGVGLRSENFCAIVQ